MATRPDEQARSTRRRGKGGRGSPIFVPTQQQREAVKMMAAMGVLKHVQIAALTINPNTGKGISKITLHRWFRDELNEGMTAADHKVVQALYAKAIGSGHQAVTAAIWWTKNRLGWTNNERVEHTAPDGGTTFGVLVVPGTVSPSEWIARQTEKNGKKKAPVAPPEDS